MFDKKFWEKFIEQNGCNFDGNARLFYLYSGDHDTEEENLTLRIFTDSILEIIYHNVDDESKKKYKEFQYIQMDSIKEVHFTSDLQ